VTGAIKTNDHLLVSTSPPSRRLLFCIILFFLSTYNVFADSLISLYEYCLRDLNNYNSIGYKAYILSNQAKGINLNSGFAKASNGIFDFIIFGKGFVRVIKDGKTFYTRRGVFTYDFDEMKIVNYDGYTLELRKQVNENTTRMDLMVDIRIFEIDVQKCQTIDNIYFEYDAIPERDYKSHIIFGHVETSNVSAFHCLLMMRYIIYKNINHIKNAYFVLENINMLIYKLNTDEYLGRDDNWILIQQWLPYLEIMIDDSVGEAQD
jgi:hypothetical protein